jgi:hypothetical protein
MQEIAHSKRLETTLKTKVDEAFASWRQEQDTHVLRNLIGEAIKKALTEDATTTEAVSKMRDLLLSPKLRQDSPFPALVFSSATLLTISRICIRDESQPTHSYSDGAMRVPQRGVIALMGLLLEASKSLTTSEITKATGYAKSAITQNLVTIKFLCERNGKKWEVDGTPERGLALVETKDLVPA